VPSKKGNPQLAPVFVEFMMGLPAGWVTDVDITRNEMLKALGNGVVWQQASTALRVMLSWRLP
jgi:DNA (cytosine-5)-methyltransferase 1